MDLFIFVFSLFLIILENKNIVRSWVEIAPIFRGPGSWSFFWILRLVTQYGSVVWIGYNREIRYGIVGFVIAYLVDKISFYIYHSNQIKKVAIMFIDDMRSEAMKNKQKISEEQLLHEALARAEIVVKANMERQW